MLSIGVAITSWIPKYRGDVLVDEVAEYTKKVLVDILMELDCEPLAVEVMPDHVFSIYPPRLSPDYVVNYLKGKSAKKLLQRKGEAFSRFVTNVLPAL